MKNRLRKEIRNKRESMSREEIAEKSRIITRKFLNSDYYKNSNVIMSYISIKNEIDMKEINEKIISDGKKLILPVIERENIKSVQIDSYENMEEKKFGVIEPISGKEVDKSEIDLIIVPGVAFDIKGNRIGFGKGYYDRFLKGYSGKKIVLAYDFQVVENIDAEEHDERVEEIITEARDIKIV